jgi:PAS domain S-box-containing protein
LPFSAIYLVDPTGTRAVRKGLAGVGPEQPMFPEIVALDGDPSGWGIAEALRTGAPVVREGLPETFAALPTGDWDRPPTRAVAFPLARPGQAQPAGVLVAGLNPCRPFDDDFRGFVGLVASQIASAVSRARAYYEEERQRAEALAALDRAKTTFFSNISHELRTPLTLMLGPLAELLELGDALPPHLREALTMAHRNGLRMRKLINSLLDFSRIEGGSERVHLAPVDLPALTRDLASAFRSAIEAAGLAYVVDCPPADRLVYVDRGMWEKIVLNLLSNAFKFTHEGTIEVSLRMRDGAAELCVRDTGEGIATAEHPRLFERFYRVEGARGRTHEGTGIGLSLVQELAKLHGGAVSVESAPGKGSAFTVRIPLRVAARHEAIADDAPDGAAMAPFVEEALRWLPEAAPAIAPEGGGNARRPRVLLADDNADMRAYVRRVLASTCDVTAVADGVAALAAARQRPFDLVLSDVMMPGLDGFALLRALRAAPATALLPVIMLSARAGEESTGAGLAAGADDYLVKPFGAQELVARVHAHLRTSRLRKEAEERLLAWKHRYEAATRASGQILYDHDFTTGEVIYGGDPEPLVGYSIAELEGGVARWIELVHPDDRGAFQRAVERLQEKEDNPCIGYRVVRKDGVIIHCQDCGYLVRDEVGRALRMVGFVADVTARRRLMEERDALLDSERMARAEAERANRLKDEFLAAMSHELRTPLNAILGWVQMLRRGTLPPATVARALSVIERNTRVQEQLVSDLLDISRITSGKLQAARERVDLARAVEAALDAVKDAAAARSIRIARTLSSAWVVGDAGRLSQVAWNLIGNAIKFSAPEARVEVTVAAREEAAILMVRDFGQGIEPAFLPHLFERFRQADGTTARRYGGLGLGLSIVQSLVELHGGNVRAESEGKGRGATFTVELPLADSFVLPDGMQAEGEDALSDLGGLSVLVVDDEPEARELLVRILEEAGIEAVEAGSAAEALGRLSRGTIDVLVSDLGMPGEDGFQLIRQVRARGQKLPAVALTAFTWESDRQRALAAGFDAHVPKPVYAHRLLSVIKRLSGGERPEKA